MRYLCSKSDAARFGKYFIKVDNYYGWSLQLLINPYAITGISLLVNEDGSYNRCVSTRTVEQNINPIIINTDELRIYYDQLLIQAVRDTRNNARACARAY